MMETKKIKKMNEGINTFRECQLEKLAYKNGATSKYVERKIILAQIKILEEFAELKNFEELKPRIQELKDRCSCLGK